MIDNCIDEYRSVGLSQTVGTGIYSTVWQYSSGTCRLTGSRTRVTA